MNWLNIQTKTRTAPEFVGAEPTDRATWLCLMLHCAEHENGGIIRDCAQWGDRRWMQTCGVTKTETQSATDLWRIDGADLALWGYPTEKEAEVVSKRIGGAKGGKKSRRRSTPISTPISTPLSCADNGKEGKGKEEERNIEREKGLKIENVNVRNVIECRPEFASLKPESVALILHNHSADPDFATKLDDFICDASNAIEPPKNPTGMLRAYLGRASKPIKPSKQEIPDL